MVTDDYKWLMQIHLDISHYDNYNKSVCVCFNYTTVFETIATVWGLQDGVRGMSSADAGQLLGCVGRV